MQNNNTEVPVSEDQSLPRDRSEDWFARVWSPLFGYLYLLLWCMHFKTRTKLAPYLPYVVGVISLSELMIAGFDSFERALHNLLKGHVIGRNPLLYKYLAEKDGQMHSLLQGLAFHETSLIVVAAVSMLIVCFMVWHHHRVQRRLEKYDELLGSLRQLFVKGISTVVSKPSEKDIDDFIKEALRMLRGLHPQLITAGTVLKKHSGLGSRFQIRVQSPPDTYNLPSTGLTEVSAAGTVLQAEAIREIVLVPWTKVRHGIRIKLPLSGRSFVRDFFIAEYAYELLGDECGCPPKSVLCAQIPTREASAVKYVLCLDSRKRNFFKDIHFQAIQVVANVIGVVLSESRVAERNNTLVDTSPETGDSKMPPGYM